MILDSPTYYSRLANLLSVVAKINVSTMLPFICLSLINFFFPFLSSLIYFNTPDTPPLLLSYNYQTLFLIYLPFFNLLHCSSFQKFSYSPLYCARQFYLRLGGAYLGFYHIGVVKALFYEGLLPRVVR